MLSIQVQMHQVPFSTTLTVQLLLFWQQFSIWAQIKRESFKLIEFVRLGFQIWQWQWVPWWVPSSIQSQCRQGISPLANSVKWKCQSPLWRWSQWGEDDVLDSADEADISQGSMSLLDISATDDEDTRKCKAREIAHKSDTDFTGWKDKLIHVGVMGLQERDSTVNDYADGGKRRPKNPDPLGPPISYMKEWGLFQPLPSTTNPMGLCHFYPVDSASVSTLAPLKPLAMAEHLKGLLLLAKMQRRPYIIIVFQGGPVTPLGLLQELHTQTALACLPIFRSDETKDGHRPHMSCCPFCSYTIQNDPSYLNHIIGMHYHANFACGNCLSALTASGQQMKKHLNECPGLTPLLRTTSQESVGGDHLPKKSAHGSKHSGSKKKGCHSKKSWLASTTSQEDSQASDRCVTRAASTSQESMVESMKCHSQWKKKAKMHKKEKSSKWSGMHPPGTLWPFIAPSHWLVK